MKRWITILHLLLSHFLFAQVEDAIEQSVQRSSSSFDYTGVLERLNSWKQHPIDLNKLGKEELMEFPFLTSNQIQSFLSYRLLYGQLFSVFELSYIEGWDKQTINMILPFVKVEQVDSTPKLTTKNFMKYARSNLFLRWQRSLEKRRGYLNDGSYLGDANHYYLRYRTQFYDKVSFGFTAEKDPGEEFSNGKFDFYSMHFFYRSKGNVQQLAIGDFEARFGQGLVCWNGISFGKSVELVQADRYGIGLRPYTSSNESNYFRGAGVSVRLSKKMTATVLYSNKWFDANLVHDSVAMRSAFSSIDVSGYHRTVKEKQKANTLHTQVGGGFLKWSLPHVEIGFSSLFQRLSLPQTTQLATYQNFRKLPRFSWNMGTDWKVHLGKMYMFGEIALNQENGKAGIIGLQIRPISTVEFSISQRVFGNKYSAQYGRAFGERTLNNAERGTYVGAKVLVSKDFTLSSYLDLYRFTWLQHQVDFPSEGYEYAWYLQWHRFKHIKANLRFRHEEKQVTFKDEGAKLDQIGTERRSFLRLHTAYYPIENVRISTRAELSLFDDHGGEQEIGRLIYQDLQYSFPSFPMKLSCRFSIFETPSFNSRIYAYESNLLYVFRVPSFYAHGYRAYLNLKLELNKRLSFWAKIGRTAFFNQDEIGSGNQLISGNTLTDLGIQARLKF